MSKSNQSAAVDRLLTAQEVADYLVIPVATLYRWRTFREGPRAARIGKHLRYRLSDVVSWVDSQVEDPRKD